MKMADERFVAVIEMKDPIIDSGEKAAVARPQKLLQRILISFLDNDFRRSNRIDLLFKRPEWNFCRQQTRRWKYRRRKTR